MDNLTIFDTFVHGKRIFFRNVNSYVVTHVTHIITNIDIQIFLSVKFLH